MIKDSSRYPLHHLLLEDLFGANKLVVLLLLLLLSTSLATIWITHKTRSLVAENNELVIQHQELENEYRNLEIEEATRSDNTVIEKIAIEDLKMNRITSAQEEVIVE